MHLDQEQVQRLLHRELGPAESMVKGHLDTCQECRSNVAEAAEGEAWIFARLRGLDHPVPRVNPKTLLPARRRAGRGYERLAAGMVLAVVAAGAAYALPGSPLPGVVHRIVELVQGTPRHQAPTASTPQPYAGFQAGIAVDPGDRLTILFPAQSGASAVVSLADGGDVTVRALDGASFTSDVDRLLIEHRAVPEPRYEIQIPRAAPRVEIQVGGRRVLLQQRGRIISAVAPDALGRYRLALSGSLR